MIIISALCFRFMIGFKATPLKFAGGAAFYESISVSKTREQQRVCPPTHTLGTRATRCLSDRKNHEEIKCITTRLYSAF